MRGRLYYKKHIEKLINSNPTTISITRTIKTDDGYSGHIETEIEITAIVSFYKKRSVRETVNEAGVSVGYMGINIEKVLSEFEADIEEGDIFNANNRTYKVLFVNTYLDICKQIELGVIKSGH